MVVLWWKAMRYVIWTENRLPSASSGTPPSTSLLACDSKSMYLVALWIPREENVLAGYYQRGMGNTDMIGREHTISNTLLSCQCTGGATQTRGHNNTGGRQRYSNTLAFNILYLWELLANGKIFHFKFTATVIQRSCPLILHERSNMKKMVHVWLTTIDNDVLQAIDNNDMRVRLHTKKQTTNEFCVTYKQRFEELVKEMVACE
jgi:hypothetical protein